MALQQKVVNGQENSLAIVDSAKFYEVQTYLSHTNHLFYSQIILISKIVWDKLSEADKKLIISAQNDAIDWQRKYSADQENSLLQELRNKGLVDNEVDMQAFKEALTPIRENYINKYGDKATEIYRIIDQAE
jgi:TRAP-type C4-dicarboxylate transport system substrate-binding protein